MSSDRKATPAGRCQFLTGLILPNLPGLGAPQRELSERNHHQHVWCLGFTVRYGHVQSNPCRDLTLPSPQRQTDPQGYLSHEEVTELLEKLTPEFWTKAACCYYAALRASDALGLRWREVDIEAGPSMFAPARRKLRSTRCRSLCPLLAKLEAHRQTEGAVGLHRIEQNALVFVTCTGRPQSRRHALRAANVASKHIGLWSEEDGREPGLPQRKRKRSSRTHSRIRRCFIARERPRN